MSIKDELDAEIMKTAREVANKMIDEGRFVETGWDTLSQLCLPPDAPDYQLKEMRLAFFAGAQHMFGTLMNMMDNDAEPTDADVERLKKIMLELDKFLFEFKKYMPQIDVPVSH